MRHYGPNLPEAESALSFTLKPSPRQVTWMVSMADLFSLLLTFFVMFYSMSTLKTQTLQTMMAPVKQENAQNSIAPQIQPSPTPITDDVPRERIVPGRNLDYLYNILQGQLSSNPALKAVQIENRQDGVAIVLSGASLFNEDQITPSATTTSQIAGLAEILSRIDNRVMVESYADDQTPRGDLLSHWELALKRTEQIAQSLQSAGYPYQPEISARLAPVDLAEGARLSSQPSLTRVDIIVRENVAKLPSSF